MIRPACQKPESKLASSSVLRKQAEYSLPPRQPMPVVMVNRLEKPIGSAFSRCLHSTLAI